MREPSPAGRARALLGAAVLVATAAASTPASPSPPHDGSGGACRAAAVVSQEPTPRPDCCYTNRSYAGVCVVKPGEDETCASILAYLNDPRAQGKTYCGGTNLRGGWQQVPCEPAPPAPAGESMP